MPVRGPPVSVILLWILRSQRCGDGFTDGIMYVEPIPVGLHEWECPDALLCVLRRCIREHGAQNRYCHATYHRRCLQRPACLEVGDIGKEQTGELFNHLLCHT